MGNSFHLWILDIPVLVIVGIVPIPRVLIAAALCASGGFAALHHECVALNTRMPLYSALKTLASGVLSGVTEHKGSLEQMFSRSAAPDM